MNPQPEAAMQRGEELLRLYGAASASAVAPLWDRHDPARTACRIIPPDLTGTPLTYNDSLFHAAPTPAAVGGEARLIEMPYPI